MNEHVQRLLREAVRLVAVHPMAHSELTITGIPFKQVVHDAGKTDSRGILDIHYLRVFMESAEPVLEWQITTGWPGTYRVQYHVWSVQGDGTVQLMKWSWEENHDRYMEWFGTALELQIGYPGIALEYLPPDDSEAFAEDCLAKMHELWG